MWRLIMRPDDRRRRAGKPNNLADSTAVALPTVDQAPYAEETKPFETDESAATPPPYRVTARISIPFPIPTPVWSDAEVARLLAISTPPLSPLSPWSSPLPQIPSPPLPQIPSPPLPVSSPVPVLSPSPPASPIRLLGYRAAMIRLRAEAVSTSYSLTLPPPIILSHTRLAAPSSKTSPLHLLSTDRREDRPEVTLPPRKRLGIALGPAYEVGESSSAAVARPAGGLRANYCFVANIDREIRRDLERDIGYGITNSWDEIVEAMQGTPVVTDVTELSQRMTEDDRLLAGRLNMLFRDRRAHARTARLIETKARMSREAWGRSMDASDLARAEVMSLRTTVLAQQSQIRELQSVDRRRQTVITEMLAADHKRQKQLTEALKLIKRLQTQMTEFERHQGPTKGPAQPELPEEAGNALTWWNSHVRTVGNDIAYAMTWTKLKKKMTDKYCPRTEIKKLEVELWEWKVKDEKYFDGLPDMIHGSVVASKPETMQEATKMAIEVMDKRIRTFVDPQTENKRKPDNNQQPQQQYQNKRQNTGMAYAVGTVEKKPYGGSKPLCSKCNYHHDATNVIFKLSLAKTQEGMPRWIEESTRNEAIYTHLTLRRSTKVSQSRIATLAIRVRQSNPTA
ncbi:hypothetical protein Tco_0383486 [Tanacetum coccineum]